MALGGFVVFHGDADGFAGADDDDQAICKLPADVLSGE